MINKAFDLMASGKYLEADKILRKILTREPHNISALYNRGVLLHKLGNTKEGLMILQKTVKLAQDFPEAYLSLASIQLELNKLEDAETNYLNALRLNPRMDRAHFRLGNIYESQGVDRKASKHYQKCIDLMPGYWEYQLALGQLLLRANNYARALPYLQTAVRLDPGNQHAWRLLSQCLVDTRFTCTDERLEEDLLGVLSRGLIDLQNLSFTIANVLQLDERLSELYALGRRNEWTPDDVGEAVKICGIDHPLLLLTLKSIIITDPPLELALTRLRAQLLMVTAPEGADLLNNPAYLQFLCALAHCCFNNEYVFEESEQEAAAAEQLVARINAKLDHGETCPPHWLVLLAAYRPLHRLSFSPMLLEGDWPHNISDIIKQQVAEPLQEALLRDKVIQLTSIDDDVSLTVRDQYEENPYPRWAMSSQADVEPLSIKTVINMIFPYVDVTHLPETNSPHILVAGCGTGRHAINAAMRYKNSAVTAIDLSKASLAYAIRAASRLDIKNIRFCQADILKLGEINQRFDLIESCGVLHHMRDPIAAWRILVDLLHAGGVMKIALYSELARESVVKARKIIAASGYSSSMSDIRRFRRSIIDGKLSVELGELVHGRDFYSTSTCRDLLFHVQEHRFNIPQLKNIIEGFDLEFLGFELPDARQADLYKELFPDDPAMLSLDNWHLYEQKYPHTFGNMYPIWLRKHE